MRDKIYLVLNRRGVQRMTKMRLPALKGSEVAVQLSITVDDSNFITPLAYADLEVPENMIITQPEVDVTIAEPDSDPIFNPDDEEDD